MEFRRESLKEVLKKKTESNSKRITYVNFKVKSKEISEEIPEENSEGNFKGNPEKCNSEENS